MRFITLRKPCLQHWIPYPVHNAAEVFITLRKSRNFGWRTGSFRVGSANAARISRFIPCANNMPAPSRTLGCRDRGPWPKYAAPRGRNGVVVLSDKDEIVRIDGGGVGEGDDVVAGAAVVVHLPASRRSG